MLALLAASGCAHQTRAVQPAATFAPAARPSVAVRHAAEPSPSTAPATAVAVAVAPAPTGPAIFAASATPRVVHAGDTVVWKVRTSADITAVDAKAAGFTIPLQKEGAGRFGTSLTIPAEMPGFFHGTYHIDIEARARSGATAKSQLVLTVE